MNALVDRDDELRLGPPATSEDLARAAAIGRALAEAADRHDPGEVDRLDTCYTELRDRHIGRAQAAVMEAFSDARFRRAEEFGAIRQRQRDAQQAAARRQDLTNALARGVLALPHQIVFDLEACWACGGRGQTAGRRGQLGRCGGCDGRGQRRSAAGRRAAAALERLAARLLDVPADHVKVGDALLVRGTDGELYPQRVASVETQANGAAQFRFADSAASGVAALVHPAAATLRRAPTDKQQAAILAKAARLQGCSVRELPVGADSAATAGYPAAGPQRTNQAAAGAATHPDADDGDVAAARLAKLELVAQAARPVVVTWNDLRSGDPEDMQAAVDQLAGTLTWLDGTWRPARPRPNHTMPTASNDMQQQPSSRPTRPGGR